jgi:pimeloyl-ACP methyl ester carboxylesterase
MTTFALVHGAFHGGWAFNVLRPHLENRGHVVITPDLPIEDRSAGCVAYAQTVVDALKEVAGDDVIVVGHSLGGLTLPLVAAARPVRSLVYLCAFVPYPGRSFGEGAASDAGIFPETPEATWPVTNDDGSLSWPPDRAIPALYPDCPPDLAAWAAARLRRQWTTPHQEVCPLAALPHVPAAYVLAREDTNIGADWARRTARERLGTGAIELDGGHSPFLARPVELAGMLLDIATPAR